MAEDVKVPAVEPDQTPSEKNYYEPYAAHTRNLRLWLLAYGVGGPVLLVSNEKVWVKFAAAPHADCIAYLFLAGVALQIAAVILFKATMWVLYMDEIGQSPSEKWVRRLGAFSCKYWPELVAEIGTLALFSAATILLIRALLP